MLAFFGIRERGSTWRAEVLGGITTFATMAYIIVLNPAILEKAGIEPGPSTVATILTATFGCLLMGLYANQPIAVAPYMGENAFLAFGLAAYHIGWRERLGTVFVAGILFLLLTLLRIRTWLADAISPSLKHSFAVGIGLFLLWIGLYQTGIVTSFVEGLPASEPFVQDGRLARPDVPVKLGDLRDLRVQLALGGFLAMSLLLYWNVRGALLIGIAVTGFAGYVLGLGAAPARVFAWPWDEQYHLERLAFQLDVQSVLQWSFLPILLTLFLVSFLDTLGTIFALGAAGNMLDEQGRFPDLHKPMLVDSLACVFGALVGTSTSGAYIESAVGIREGARTGLAAVVTGLLFALTLFFIPLFEPLQQLTFAYGPALIVVGMLMFGAARHIDCDDVTELVPALATIAVMVFSFNIANGLTAGLILHPLLKLLCGQWRRLHPGGVLLGLLCAAYYVFGLPH